MALLYRCFVLGDPHAQAFPVRVAHDPHAPVLVGDLKSQIATERGWSVPGFDPQLISVYAAAGAPQASVAAMQEHEFGALDGLDELPPPSTTAKCIDFVVTKPAAPTAPGAAAPLWDADVVGILLECNAVGDGSDLHAVNSACAVQGPSGVALVVSTLHGINGGSTCDASRFINLRHFLEWKRTRIPLHFKTLDEHTDLVVFSVPSPPPNFTAVRAAKANPEILNKLVLLHFPALNKLRPSEAVFSAEKGCVSSIGPEPGMFRCHIASFKGSCGGAYLFTSSWELAGIHQEREEKPTTNADQVHALWEHLSESSGVKASYAVARGVESLLPLLH
eukprot:TRINITY_DN12056_c0_g1_i2.p1 TRINITY_DN12056_c0_g1~~TRINITY_DN12056_c0_g1_i2.p1  ORF type:complete len:334 (-),score=38.85 TRINITY_DN12056_c0_g1_i2:133-1134(-)